MDPIRRAVPADLDAILALYGRITEAMAAVGLTHWDASYPAPADVEADLERGTVYVQAGLDGLVAVAVLDRRAPPEYRAVRWAVPLDDSLYVHRLGVDPRMRRQGVARRFMAFAREHAIALGLAAVKLDAYRDNPGASGLYPALGYTHTGEVTYPPHPAPFLTFELIVRRSNGDSPS